MEVKVENEGFGESFVPTGKNRQILKYLAIAVIGTDVFGEKMGGKMEKEGFG